MLEGLSRPPETAQDRPQLALAGARLARTVTLYASGTKQSVIGADGARGLVIVQQSWNARRWTTAVVVRASSAGTFRVRFHPTRAGSLHVHGTFPEAPNYIDAAATISVWM